jgi:shikimate kinase
LTLLYLTGFMGTGKSAVGPQAARALGYTYIDLDRVIAQAARMTVPEIFEREGEASFRARESAALAEVSGRDRCVVATGGGVVLSEANRRRMAETGHVVCLTASVEAIVRRTGRGRGRRPLLAGEGDLDARVRTLLAEREPFYRECHHIVDTTGRSVAQVAKEIVELHREGAWRR